jgi:tricorn protease-like protein
VFPGQAPIPALKVLIKIFHIGESAVLGYFQYIVTRQKKKLRLEDPLIIGPLGKIVPAEFLPELRKVGLGHVFFGDNVLQGDPFCIMLLDIPDDPVIPFQMGRMHQSLCGFEESEPVEVVNHGINQPVSQVPPFSGVSAKPTCLQAAP